MKTYKIELDGISEFVTSDFTLAVNHFSALCRDVKKTHDVFLLENGKIKEFSVKTRKSA